MRIAAFLLGTLFLFSLPNLSMSQTVATGETISGRSLQAIHAALPEFNREGLDLSDFEITVREDGEFYAVDFLVRERPTGMRGSLRGEFTALVNKSDLRLFQIIYAR